MFLTTCALEYRDCWVTGRRAKLVEQKDPGLTSSLTYTKVTTVCRATTDEDGNLAGNVFYN